MLEGIPWFSDSGELLPSSEQSEQMLGLEISPGEGERQDHQDDNHRAHVVAANREIVEA
jgi:hypothetical protein